MGHFAEHGEEAEMMATLTRQSIKAPNGTGQEQEFVSLDGLLTVEQWAAMPELKPPYELIAGRLVQKMVTTNAHNWAAEEFLMACKLWSRQSGWKFFGEGPGVKVGPGDGYIPDVMGYAPDAVIDRIATCNIPPYLAVEVLSPGTARLDRKDKKQNYAHAGVYLYVLVDTEKHLIEVYRLHGDEYGKAEVLRDNVMWQPAELPGLQVELANLWLT